MFKWVTQKGLNLALYRQQYRTMSLWEKFTPKFMKNNEKSTPKKDNKVVPVQRDDIRERLLDAEVQDFMELSKKSKEEWLTKHAERKKQESIKQKTLEKEVAKVRDDQIEKLEIPPVYSIFEMMETFEENEDGSISLPLLKDNEEVKTFENKETYESWYAIFKFSE